MNEFVVSELRKLVERAAAEFEPGLLSPLTATRAIEEWAAIEKIACAQKLRAATRAEDVGVDAEGVVASASGLLTGAARKQTKAARKATGKTKDAFERGQLSPTQAGAIADATEANPAAEESLLELARRASTTELVDACERVRREAGDDATLAARQREARFVRTWKDGLGMTRIAGAFEPLLGAKLVAEIDARAQRLFREQSRGDGDADTLEHRMADALTGMVGDVRGPKRGARTVVRLIATKDAVERGYLLPGEKCETAEGDAVPLPALDDALRDKDTLVQEVVDVSKIITYKRYIPKRMRDALESIGVGCVVPGCGRTKHLEIDHTVERRDGGPTTLANLGFLCPYHHRLKSARLYDLWHDTDGWRWEPRRARAPSKAAG